MAYNWERFWCEREGSYALSDHGFLADYGKRLRAFSPSLRTFSQISGTPALILLGEPGIGKTQAILAERGSIERDVAQRGEYLLWPDLRTVDTSESFRRAVIDTDAFRAWVNDKALLHLYLDALDECMLRVGTIGKILTEALASGQTTRLSLRLTCRTAEWRNEVERDLKQIFGPERVKAYELLPLREEDAAEAARANEIDESAFLSYVHTVGIGALASRPIPLKFIIKCFLRNDLPDTQSAVYERGCLELCTEFEHRNETGLRRSLSTEQRLEVAKRIAAYSIFASQPVILNGDDDDDVPVEILRMAEIAGGHESVNGNSFEVDEHAIRDALDTGLFTSRGAKVLGWAHHTYQEYLAAKYLAQRRLPIAQILPLLIHPESADRKLTPQLHGVAAWLSALVPDVFDHVATHEPDLLVRNAVVLDQPLQRRRLVAELLALKRTGGLGRFDVTELHKFEKLRHSTLHEQLGATLGDRSVGETLRRLAADIAKHTSCAELLPMMADIALAPAEPIELRIDCASAVARSNADAQRARLRELIHLPAETRQDRWLVRLGVMSAWPCALNAAELFALLDAGSPLANHLTGEYVLVDHVRRTLRADDLPIALHWVLRRCLSRHEGTMFGIFDDAVHLENAIVVDAWKNVRDPDVGSLLARIAANKVRRYEPMTSRETDEISFQERIDTDTDRRRHFLTPLIQELLCADGRHRYALEVVYGDTKFVHRDDLDWLLSRDVLDESAVEEFFATLIMSLADLTQPSVFERVFGAAERNAALARQLADICRAVAIGSEEANAAREMIATHSAFHESRARRSEHRPQQPTRLERIRQALDQVAQDIHTFWRLADELSLSDESPYYDRLNLAFPSFTGYLEADDNTRRRIADLAVCFLQLGDPETDNWFATKEFGLAAVGGVRALMLLKSEAPAQFAGLNSETWRKWTGALLGVPNNDPVVPLLREAYPHAAEEVRRRVQQLIRAGDVFVVHKLSDVLDEALTRAIVEAADSPALEHDGLSQLLDAILAPDNVVARQFTEALVVRPAGNTSRQIAIVAASNLLLKTPRESWATLWPLMKSDQFFGRAVVAWAANHDRLATPIYALEEDRLGDLYLWLCQEYPPEQDPEREGPYAPDTADNVARWRSMCLDALRQRGTAEACAALRRLMQSLPQQPYLPDILIEAEANRRANTWQAISSGAMRALLSNREQRFVRSESELIDVILESLTRLQNNLQGETPAAWDLWNTSPEQRPKTETEFSDYLVRHFRSDLRERGVILGREVQIRRGTATGGGEITDIHIDAVSDTPGAAATITVILEAKGCWNPGLAGDMRAQLAERYLRGSHSRTGLYVVACFRSPGWRARDRRRRPCFQDTGELRRHLEAESAQLATAGLDVRPFLLDCSVR